jgi:hypothetical protein
MIAGASSASTVPDVVSEARVLAARNNERRSCMVTNLFENESQLRCCR